jgi:hypothetical protein
MISESMTYPSTPAINGNPEMSPEPPFLRMLKQIILGSGKIP